MRICFTLNVRKEKLDEYKKRHAAVWPEMQEALRRTGWKNYSIFACPNGQIIGYLEADDFKKCCDEMQKEPINAVWQEGMTPFFESLSGAAADTSMSPLEEIFHLD